MSVLNVQLPVSVGVQLTMRWSGQVGAGCVAMSAQLSVSVQVPRRSPPQGETLPHVLVPGLPLAPPVLPSLPLLPPPALPPPAAASPCCVELPHAIVVSGSEKAASA